MKPVPFSIARAGARSAPSVRAALWRLAGSEGRSYGFVGHVGPAPVWEIVSGRTCSFGKRDRSSFDTCLPLVQARPDDHRRAGAGEGRAERSRGEALADHAEERRRLRPVRLVQAVGERRLEEIGRPAASAAPSSAARPAENAASAWGTVTGSAALDSAVSAARGRDDGDRRGRVSCPRSGRFAFPT